MDEMNLFVNIMKKYSLDLNTEMLNKLFQYTIELIEYPVNLTAVKDYQKAFSYHIADSLIPLFSNRYFQNSENIVDVGSGGGVPGIPIAIAFPDKKIHLVESIKKKTDALEYFVKKLNLKNVIIYNQRIEEFSSEYRNYFDYSTCRAVARADISLEYCAPLIKKEGYTGLYKGPLFGKQEYIYSDKACGILNLKKEEIINYEIYDSDEKERCLVIYKKTAETDSKYPRKSGIPLKKPLGGK